jgi:putative membrane protein
MLLMRTVVNALALLVTVLLVPKIYFLDNTLTTWLLVAVLLGLLNAFIKPVIQFAMLRFIFATYGVVVALINAVVLLLLALLLPNRFAVDSLFWALVGGGVIGLLSTLLENLLGLTPPIVSEKYPEVREMIRERDVHQVEDYVARVEAKEAGQPKGGAAEADAGQAAADAAAVLAVVGTTQQPDVDVTEARAPALSGAPPVADDGTPAEQQEA